MIDMPLPRPGYLVYGVDCREQFLRKRVLRGLRLALLVFLGLRVELKKAFCTATTTTTTTAAAAAAAAAAHDAVQSVLLQSKGIAQRCLGVCGLELASDSQPIYRQTDRW